MTRSFFIRKQRNTLPSLNYELLMKMTISVRTLIFALCIAMLFTVTSEKWWNRRRRSSPPPCRASDCEVSSWSSWSACSYPCGTSGMSYRTRDIISSASCGGSCPYSFRDTKACNRGGCSNYGRAHSTGCNCRPGYTGRCCGYGECVRLVICYLLFMLLFDTPG